MSRDGVLVVLLAWATCASAVDEWDAGAVKDNAALTTRNMLRNRVTQRHDLEAIAAVPDEDWFVLNVEAFRQYHIAVTEVTGDTPIGNADFLVVYDDTGTSVRATGSGGTVSSSTTWYSGTETSFRVRVKGGPTTPGTARYAITYHESTMYCTRYNQSGSQASVAIVQNTTDASCPVSVWFYDEAGALTGNIFGNAPGGGNIVAAASSVGALAGTKGNVRVISPCAPGTLRAKVVSLEPATGFSFDTACERR